MLQCLSSLDRGVVCATRLAGGTTLQSRISQCVAHSLPVSVALVTLLIQV